MSISEDRLVVAIHQPNFFPWLGYFNKIACADVFIVMDQVQFPRTGKGTWSNRVKLMVNGTARWITMPVIRAYEGLRNINEIQVDETSPWRTKMLKTIELNYGQAPHFDAVFPVLDPIVNNPANYLAEYNVSAIVSLLDLLGLDKSKLISGSRLNVQGRATDLLIAMVKAVGGTSYLCGGGASGYQEDKKFEDAGLDLIYQNFNHPEYPQITNGGFTPGLSIIDVLMNCGFEKTKLLIS